MFIQVRKKIKLKGFNTNCFKVTLKCIKFKNQSSFLQRFLCISKKNFLLLRNYIIIFNDFLLFCFREKNL